MREIHPRMQLWVKSRSSTNDLASFATELNFGGTSHPIYAWKIYFCFLYWSICCTLEFVIWVTNSALSIKIWKRTHPLTQRRKLSSYSFQYFWLATIPTAAASGGKKPLGSPRKPNSRCHNLLQAETQATKDNNLNSIFYGICKLQWLDVRITIV